MQVAVTYDESLTADAPLDMYGSVKMIPRSQGYVIQSYPKRYANELGIPKVVSSSAFRTLATSNLNVIETICFYIPSESGAAITNTSIGTFCVETQFTFKGKSS